VLPFVLARSEVWAFHDLADPKGPFREVVDLNSAEKVDAAALLKSDDRNIYVWLLNSALRNALLRRGVRHDRDRNRYYFLPDHETVAPGSQAGTIIPSGCPFWGDLACSHSTDSCVFQPHMSPRSTADLGFRPRISATLGTNGQRYMPPGRVVDPRWHQTPRVSRLADNVPPLDH
jgi:hypothetical protein